MGTLVMLHGLTGTSEMIRPLGETLCPEGWDLFLPDGPLVHPKRGRGWWIREEPPEAPLDESTFEQIAESLSSLKSQIPDGPLIVGGFSQGSALAQELLTTDCAERIHGIIIIGGKSARPEELRSILSEQPSRQMISMHGESDHIVPVWQADQTVNIFREANWDVTLLRHHKGHMVNLAQQQELVDWVQMVAEISDNGS
jgi:predicted esterase